MVLEMRWMMVSLDDEVGSVGVWGGGLLETAGGGLGGWFCIEREHGHVRYSMIALT